jgi:hypothetical protein
VLGSVPDLVEAAVRVGEPERAAEAFSRFEPWALAVGTARSGALLLRCRALLADGDHAAALYLQALAGHDGGAATLDAARTQLLFGEHLRCERRRVEARPHLLAAVEEFERLGAHSWAERARAELRAAGGVQVSRRQWGGPSATPPGHRCDVFPPR